MDKEKIKQKLQIEKKELERDLASYRSEDPLLGPNKGYTHSPEDGPYDAESHERIEATRREINSRLVEVDRALAKIQDDGWGACESCGQMIAAARLEAIPTARFCLDCENKAKRR